MLSINFDIRLILINAIYFKANWLKQFQEIDTEPMKFQVRNGLEVDYDYGMNMKGNLYYTDNVKVSNESFPAQILELPYENENFRMLLILPNEDVKIEELNIQDLDYEILDTKLGKGKKFFNLSRPINVQSMKKKNVIAFAIFPIKCQFLKG